MYIEVIQQEAGMRVTVLLAAVSPANPLFIPNDATKEEIVKMCVEYGERVLDKHKNRTHTHTG